MDGNNRWTKKHKLKGFKGNEFTAFGTAIFAILVYLYRYVSLSSLVGITAIFIFLVVQVLVTNTSPVYLIFVGVADLMIFWQHRGNLKRLIAGTEHKLGQKSWGP